MSLDHPDPNIRLVLPAPAAAEVRAEPDFRPEDVESAAQLFKALSHEGRLQILCHLAEGAKTVTELELLLGQRQAAVSQQLARLRLEGLVAPRREGKAAHYSLQDPRLQTILRLLPELRAARQG